MRDPNVQAVLNGQPEQQQSNPIEDALLGWLKSMYGVSMLAPQDVRDVSTEANKSYSGMIRDTLAKNYSGALKHRRAWEQHASMLTEINRQRVADYGDALLNELPMEEKMSQVVETAMRWGDTSIAQMAEDGSHYTTVSQFYDYLTKQQQQLEQSTKTLDAEIKKMEAKIPQQQSGNLTERTPMPSIEPYLNEPNMDMAAESNSFLPTKDQFQPTNKAVPIEQSPEFETFPSRRLQ